MARPSAGITGLVLLVALTILSGDGLSLRFFVLLAGPQALFTALAEMTIAIRAKHHQGTAWLLICAGISITCSIALLLGGNLSAFEHARLIFCYLLLLGASLTVLSLRMLYIEESPSHRFGLWNALTGWREGQTTGNSLTVARRNNRIWAAAVSSRASTIDWGTDMHSVTVDTPAIFPDRTRRSLQLRRFSLQEWILIIRAAALRKLLEIVAVGILVLIPWNTAW